MAADKEVTMVLKVDLECERCNRKIRRVLQKIQDKMNIEPPTFDKKKNVVTISGPFDAAKVRRKLCCEAGRIIKDMYEVKVAVAPEEKDRGMGKEDDDGGKTAAAAAPKAVDLRPLLKKMLPVERPERRTQPAHCTCCCGCSCGKQTTRPPAQGVPSVWPAPASSVVSGHAYEAPSSYYGVPVYSIEGWHY